MSNKLQKIRESAFNLRKQEVKNRIKRYQEDIKQLDTDYHLQMEKYLIDLEMVKLEAQELELKSVSDFFDDE
jgi:hypothetical protein